MHATYCLTLKLQDELNPHSDPGFGVQTLGRRKKYHSNNNVFSENSVGINGINASSDHIYAVVNKRSRNSSRNNILTDDRYSPQNFKKVDFIGKYHIFSSSSRPPNLLDLIPPPPTYPPPQRPAPILDGHASRNPDFISADENSRLLESFPTSSTADGWGLQNQNQGAKVCKNTVNEVAHHSQQQRSRQDGLSHRVQTR